MPPVVQLIPCTACLFFFSSYLDSGQFCQSWCLHRPEWLCLSGSGLGTLHFLSSSLCPFTSPSGPWPLYFSLSPLLPPLFHLSLFHPFYILPLNSSCTTFLSLSELSQLSQRYCSGTDSSAISDAVRHTEGCWAPTLGDFTSAAKYPWCITDKDVTGWRQIGCKWHKTLAPAARTEEVVLYKHHTQSNSASAALYSLSE